MKEENEDRKEVPNQQDQSNLKPSAEQNFNMFIIPPSPSSPQNQTIDALRNKYLFVDSCGNQLSPSTVQIPNPIGKNPMIQGTSAGVQFLMLNENQYPDSISISTPCTTADRKGTFIKCEKHVPLPVIRLPDEVIYVNPRQYKRILIRRMQRYKLQEQGKIPFSRGRKKYLHESRHLHAKNRCRESRGRFSGSPTQ